MSRESFQRKISSHHLHQQKRDAVGHLFLLFKKGGNRTPRGQKGERKVACGKFSAFWCEIGYRKAEALGR